MPSSRDDDTARVEDAIAQWWRDQSEAEIEAVIPKAVEYGSTDLHDLGRELAYLMGREGLSWEECVELGIYVYVRGKFSRWVDAIRDGRRVSPDTLHDVVVYTRMAQRNRDVGGWPFAPEAPPS